MQKHPIRDAFDHWKPRGGARASFARFAKWLGYSDPDSLYRQMRGEYPTPPARAKKLAELLGISTGRYYDRCEAYERRGRRKAS